MPVMHSPPGPETVIDGRKYLYFGGTGYLGLQGRREVIEAACEAVRRYGLGSATSRSGWGDTPPVLDVETGAARLFGTEAAFYFASGYAANHVLVTALGGRFDVVFVDELSHYSVFEAARLSGRPVFRFPHRDTEGLESALGANLAPGWRPLVVTDGVFSALGTVAPLAGYRQALSRYPRSLLVVDDAHGIGVLGRRGRGTLEHLGILSEEVNAPMPGEDDRFEWPRIFLGGTLSKALGGFGGIVPGREDFIAELKGSSPYYPGASPPPVPAAAASARAIELVLAEPELLARLGENALSVKAGLASLGVPTDDTPVPIVCLRLGDAKNMQQIHRELADRDVLVPYLAAYSGLGPQGALRLAVFATHTPAMIERLLEELARVL